MKTLQQLAVLSNKICGTIRDNFEKDTSTEEKLIEKGLRRWQKKIGSKLIKNQVFISGTYD